MPKFKDHTLRQYLDVLASLKPVPGGGSAAALTGAIGMALISMVANYSLGRNASKDTDHKIRNILKKSENIRKRLLNLVDLDAEAYLKVVKSRKGTPAARKAALRQARKIPAEVCRLCYTALDLTPLLVKKGNPYLISDVQCALEMLLAAFNSAMINVEINQ